STGKSSGQVRPVFGQSKQRICVVTGAAGFIGSHLVDRLLSRRFRVIGLDNMVLGRRSNLKDALENRDFAFREVDVNDTTATLTFLREQCDACSIETIWHLAANSDIQAGTHQPDVDLNLTFLTTYNVLRVMKELGIPQLVFASSSAI